MDYAVGHKSVQAVLK